MAFGGKVSVDCLSDVTELIVDTAKLRLATNGAVPDEQLQAVVKWRWPSVDSYAAIRIVSCSAELLSAMPKR